MSYTRDIRDFVRIGRKIVCVGRNYREHITELSNPVPEKPVIFLKPTTSYLTSGSIKIPPGCEELHHEVELAVVIGEMCNNDEEPAAGKVAGYAVALDMTARDIQSEAKKKGLPWTLAKGFDTACPISEFLSRERIPDPTRIDLFCKVNGEVRQQGSTSDMIWDIPSLLSYITRYMTLEVGDVILTGTPAGVGPVRRGDKISAGITGVTEINFDVK